MVLVGINDISDCVRNRDSDRIKDAVRYISKTTKIIIIKL